MHLEHLLEIGRRLEFSESRLERPALALEVALDKGLHGVALGEPLQGARERHAAPSWNLTTLWLCSFAARLDKRDTRDTLTRAIRLCPTRWAARSFATRYVREFRRTGTASPTRRQDKNETKID